MASACTGLRLKPLTLALLLLLLIATRLPAELTNAPAFAPAEPASTELLRAFLQVQAQMQTTQAALDRNRQEAEATAAHNAELLETRLRLMEQALVGERARELDSLERSQHLMLMFAAGFAGIALLAILLSTYVQWRTAERLARMAAMPRTALALPPAMDAASLSAGTGALVPSSAADATNARLLGVVERLEQRIEELEHGAHATAATSSAPETNPSSPPPGNERSTEDSVRWEASRKAAQIGLLLGKGQTLLDLGRAEESLACFEEALRLDPRHPEALLRKGTALEQARKPDEALACYDRAIATDQTFTMAYLQKGGLCNRLERYEEALKCYEEALKSQERNGRAG